MNYIFEEVKGWKIIPNLKDCSVFCAHYRAFAESLCVESPGSQGWQVFQNSKANMPDYCSVCDCACSTQGADAGMYDAFSEIHKFSTGSIRLHKLKLLHQILSDVKVNYKKKSIRKWTICEAYCWELVYFWGGIIHSRVSSLSGACAVTYRAVINIFFKVQNWTKNPTQKDYLEI